MAIPFRLKKQRPDDGNIFGKLGAVALTDLLHMLGVNQRTATVSLSREGRSGEIFFQDGVLLHAASGSARGDEALMRLVHWKDADFVVEEGIPEDTPSTISKSVDAVLLEVMTRLDEGFVPNVTPFPGLKKPTLAEVDTAARLSRLKPPLPRARRARGTRVAVIAAIVAMALIAMAGAAYLLDAWTRVPELPPAAAPDSGPDAPRWRAEAGIAGSTLEAAIAGRTLDVWSVLEQRGLSRAETSEPRASEPESSPPPPAATEGFLLVLAVPWAEVRIDGADVGETPLPEIALSAGAHEVELDNPNVIGTIRDRVEVRSAETTRRSYSFELTGQLRVVVRPWADVYVDGRHVGQTPLGDLSVTEGSHAVELRHPTLGVSRATVVVERGETAVLEVEM